METDTRLTDVCKGVHHQVPAAYDYMPCPVCKVQIKVLLERKADGSYRGYPERH